MKCELTEMWHRSGGCRCKGQLHLNLNNKYCICFYDEPDKDNNYCGDTWKIVDQVEANKIWWKRDFKNFLEEFFEYV